ncbi:B type cyclin [Haematococcus lacustris]
MAFAVRTVLPCQEENAVLIKDGKASLNAKTGQSLLQQGSKRRAPLGDMSNLVAPLGNRTATATAKDGVKAAEPPAKPRSATVRQAQPALPPSAPGTGSTAAAPRTRSQTALAARQQPGMSMSSLLQSRSEAAVTIKAAVPPASPLPDIDSEDRNNPLAETEYVNDIYSYYRRIEPKYRVSSTYMTSQADINDKMRAILVDWLVEVHLKFKLMPETLYLTINVIDRYLEQKPVTRRNLQLVGVTAMLIACKYEEIWAPEVRDFVYISDKAYSREQILAMEKVMLSTLHFNLTLPTPYNFLARNLKAAGAHLDKQVTMLASYLSELAMIDATMLKHSYSMTAAAALYVAMRSLDKAVPYPKALARHSGYTEEAVLPCAKQLVALMQKAPTASLTAVFKKYSHTKFLEISKTAVCTAILEEDNELL